MNNNPELTPQAAEGAGTHPGDLPSMTNGEEAISQRDDVSELAKSDRQAARGDCRTGQLGRRPRNAATGR